MMKMTASTWMAALLLCQCLDINNAFVLNRPHAPVKAGAPLWEAANDDGVHNENPPSSSAFVMPLGEQNRKQNEPTVSESKNFTAIIGDKSGENVKSAAAGSALDKVANATNKVQTQTAALIPNEPETTEDASNKKEIKKNPREGTPAAKAIHALKKNASSSDGKATEKSASIVEEGIKNKPPVEAKQQDTNEGTFTPKPPNAPPPSSLYDRTEVPPLQQVPSQEKATAVTDGTVQPKAASKGETKAKQLPSDSDLSGDGAATEKDGSKTVKAEAPSAVAMKTGDMNKHASDEESIKVKAGTGFSKESNTSKPKAKKKAASSSKAQDKATDGSKSVGAKDGPKPIKVPNKTIPLKSPTAEKASSNATSLIESGTNVKDYETNVTVASKAEATEETKPVFKPEAEEQKQGKTKVVITTSGTNAKAGDARKSPNIDVGVVAEAKETPAPAVDTKLESSSKSSDVAKSLELDTHQAVPKKKTEVAGTPSQVGITSRETKSSKEKTSSVVGAKVTSSDGPISVVENVSPAKADAKSIVSPTKIGAGDKAKGIKRLSEKGPTAVAKVEETPVAVSKLHSKKDATKPTAPSTDSDADPATVGKVVSDTKEEKSGIQAFTDLFFGRKVVSEKDDAAVIQRIKERKQAKAAERESSLSEQLQATQEALDDLKQERDQNLAKIRIEAEENEARWRSQLNEMTLKVEVAEDVSERSRTKTHELTAKNLELDSEVKELKEFYASESALWTDKYDREREYRRQEQIEARERLSKAMAEAREQLKLANDEGEKRQEMIRAELTKVLESTKRTLSYTTIELKQAKMAMVAKDAQIEELSAERNSLRGLAGEAWDLVNKRTKTRWNKLRGKDGEGRKTKRVE